MQDLGSRPYLRAGVMLTLAFFVFLYSSCTNITMQNYDETMDAEMAAEKLALSVKPSYIANFSGIDWIVRRNSTPEGPQNNVFAGKGVAVSFNKDRSVTLKVAQKNGTWYGSELYMTRGLGYGTYIFQLNESPFELDPNIVLGLFTYSPSEAYYHREIDIEFSAWGVSGAPVKGQFVVQPYYQRGNMKTFADNHLSGPVSCAFTWTAKAVSFLAWSGHGPMPAPGDPSVIASWAFRNSARIPKPGDEAVHLNLYLAHGSVPPAGTGRLDITVKSFTFFAENPMTSL